MNKIEFYFNTQLFDNLDREILVKRIHELVAMRNIIQKFDEVTLNYDKTMKKILADPIVYSDSSLRTTLTLLLTSLHPKETVPVHYRSPKIGQLPDVVSLCKPVPNVCFCLLSPNLGQNWETDIIDVVGNNFSMRLNNVFDDNSTLDYLEKHWTHNILEQKILNGDRFSRGGNNVYHFEEILFHDDFESQIAKVPINIRTKIYSIFSKIIFGTKKFEDYEFHDESTSVKQNRKLKAQRLVKFSGNDKIIYFHLK
ncbi:hypothetical protein B0W51_10265, partial [Leuconostoc mesenteroides]